MWPNSTSTMNSYNIESSTLECNSYYYKPTPSRWTSNTPLVQPEASTAYDTSCDLIGTNDMFLEEYHKMWNLEKPLLDSSPSYSNPEISYLYDNTSPQPNSDGLQELLSSPMNVQQASKFPEQSFSELISGDLSFETIDKILHADRFGMNPYNDILAGSTYTKDDFEFDFGSSVGSTMGSSMGSSIGSSYLSPPAVEMNDGPNFTPSRSSTPVESPNATQENINGVQYSMPSDQNYEYYLSNRQNEVKQQQEIDGWGRQIETKEHPSRPLRSFGMASRPLRTFGNASRALKQFNYQSDEPIISRVSTYRNTSSTKKVKQIVDYCVFCFNNKEVRAVYESHTVRDTKGRCLCPTLRKYVCPICQKDGDEAHTTKYCKEKKILTEEDMCNPLRRYL